MSRPAVAAFENQYGQCAKRSSMSFVEERSTPDHRFTGIGSLDCMCFQDGIFAIIFILPKKCPNFYEPSSLASPRSAHDSLEAS
jgi:hypothetical protein